MSSTFLKSNFYYLVPYGIVILAYLVSTLATPLINKYQLLLGYAPYLLLGFTSLLGLHFNRSRILLTGILLGSSYWCLRNYVSGPVSQLLAILIPVNLVIIAFIGERGIFSLRNYIIIILITLEALTVLWLIDHPDHQLWAIAVSDIVAIPPIAGVVIAQPGQVAVLSAAVALLAGWLIKRAPLNNALLVILLAAVLALNGYHSPALGILMFILIGFMLLQSLMQDSYNMAYRDELTGLMGRRALNEALLKLGRRYVIAMLDVDRFKKFNDTHGHDVGDQVLKMVAAHLARAGGGAKAYRYGGEEFALLFPRKKLPQVKPHLEALRESIADYEMVIRSQTRPKVQKEGKKQRSTKAKKGRVQITVSIGAAQRSEQLKTAVQVLKAADESLYQAKRKGRNRVVC